MLTKEPLLLIKEVKFLKNRGGPFKKIDDKEFPGYSILIGDFFFQTQRELTENVQKPTSEKKRQHILKTCYEMVTTSSYL